MVSLVHTHTIHATLLRFLRVREHGVKTIVIDKKERLGLGRCEVETRNFLEGSGGLEVIEGNLDTGRESLLSLTDPHTGVVVLLVWLVGTVGVTNLGHEAEGG